jgi:hypothetical protein
MRKRKLLKVGESYSHATAQAEDIIPALMDALEGVDRAATRKIRRRYPNLFKRRRGSGPGWRDSLVGNVRDLEGKSDEEQECIAELEDVLTERCPPYSYVGSHPGNSSDIGCWPDLERLEEAVADGEVLKDEDVFWLKKGELPEVECILHVNDHGNITLYDRDGREIWAVV